MFVKEWFYRTEKLALQAYLLVHGKSLIEEVSAYDGVYHHLKATQDVLSVYRQGRIITPGGTSYSLGSITVEQYIKGLFGAERKEKKWKEMVKQIQTSHIANFRTYVIVPEKDFIMIGETPEQTSSELWESCSELHRDLQQGKKAYVGYTFSIPKLGLQVATIEPVFSFAAINAHFSDPFTESINQIVELLENKGFIPMALAPIDEERSRYKYRVL